MITVGRVKKGRGLACALVLSMLGACGGGGGGGGDAGGGDEAITYTGVTRQATIDADNAEDLATSAYSIGKRGSGVGGGGAVGVVREDAPGTGHSGALMVARLLSEAVRRLELTGGTMSVVGIQTSRSGSEEGLCGGSMDYSFIIDDSVGTFSGTMTFNDYCATAETASTMNGSAAIQGSDFGREFTMSTTDMVVSDGYDELVTNGEFSFSTTGTSITITEDMVAWDSATNTTYKVENFRVTLSDHGSYLAAYIPSGRFYHEQYGYVDVHTTSSFIVYSGDFYPSSGVLVAEGENASVILTASGEDYHVQADINGDGDYADPVDVDLWNSW